VVIHFLEFPGRFIQVPNFHQDETTQAAKRTSDMDTLGLGSKPIKVAQEVNLYLYLKPRCIEDSL
jgi:hypothetical protein